MKISEKELRSIIAEAISEIETEFGGPEPRPINIDNRVDQRIKKLSVEQSRTRADYDDFWRRKADEDFPNHPNDWKSSDWKQVYALLYRNSLLNKKDPKNLPKKLAVTQTANAPRKPSTTKVGQLMDMLYANFISGGRKGGVSASRDEIYKALRDFEYKTNISSSNKNSAGGAWLTQTNRANEKNQYKLRFMELSDKINKRFVNVRDYISYNANHTNQYDLRDIINRTYDKLQDLNDIINDGRTIEELLNISRMLLRSADGNQRKFYEGDVSGKNVGIIKILETIKKYAYEIPMTMNELNDTADNGYDYDIDSRGKIIKTLTESIMKTVKEKLANH